MYKRQVVGLFCQYHSQVIGWKDSSPQNDLLCVEWDVKLYTLNSTQCGPAYNYLQRYYHVNIANVYSSCCWCTCFHWHTSYTATRCSLALFTVLYNAAKKNSQTDKPLSFCMPPTQWCAKYHFQNSILFWKYKIVFYFVFLKYSYQCILFCIFKTLFSSILLFSKYFFENTFCKRQTKGKLISDRDPQLSMSLLCRSAALEVHMTEIRSF